MKEYPKIQTVFNRDPNNNFKTLLMDQFARPEFEYLQDNLWEFREKVDGTNIRIMWDGRGMAFGGKTDKAQTPGFLTAALEGLVSVEKFRLIPEFNESDGPVEVCLYGEGYGPKIQKGGKYSSEVSFVLFDVKVGPWWLKQDDVIDVARKMGLRHVPLVGTGTLARMVEMVQEGFNSSWGDFTAEGIVARPLVPLFDRQGRRIITKLKYKDFPR